MRAHGRARLPRNLLLPIDLRHCAQGHGHDNGLRRIEGAAGLSYAANGAGAVARAMVEILITWARIGRRQAVTDLG